MQQHLCKPLTLLLIMVIHSPGVKGFSVWMLIKTGPIENGRIATINLPWVWLSCVSGVEKFIHHQSGVTSRGKPGIVVTVQHPRQTTFLPSPKCLLLGKKLCVPKLPTIPRLCSHSGVRRKNSTTPTKFWSWHETRLNPWRIPMFIGGKVSMDWLDSYFSRKNGTYTAFFFGVCIGKHDTSFALDLKKWD